MEVWGGWVVHEYNIFFGLTSVFGYGFAISCTISVRGFPRSRGWPGCTAGRPWVAWSHAAITPLISAFGIFGTYNAWKVDFFFELVVPVHL